jgi:hypothetical protein
MQKNKFLVFLLLVAGLIGWRVWSRRDALSTPPAPGADVAVIVDNSSSQNLDCSGLSTLVRTALSEAEIGKASQLAIYTLGSSESSYEPVRQLVMHVEKGASGARKATRKAEQVCRAFPVTDGSSIFRAVEVVLDQLQSRGLQGSRLYMETDLEENAEKKRLLRKHGKKNAPLHNAGVMTSICGVAATTERQGPRGAHANLLEKQWLAAFADPKAVSISPFCPGQQVRASN